MTGVFPTSYSPIVDINVVLKVSSENLKRIQVFPTPESPINSNLKSRSYVFFAIVKLWSCMPTIFQANMADGTGN